MKKHIIWDFDGTLFDTYPVMTKAMSTVTKEAGIKEPKENILKLMKVSMSHMMDYFRKKHKTDQHFLSKYNSTRKALEGKTLKPFENVVDICDFVVTNNGTNHLFTHRGNSAIEFLKKFDMIDNFSELITKGSGFERKPSPQGINYLIEKYDIDKSKAIMIGDRDIDLLSAKNAGIKTCYFKQENEPDLDCADYTISHISQLRDIILALE